MLRSGAELGDNVKVINKPYIIFQSRCERFIRKKDFVGRLKIGHNVTIHSSPRYPIPNPIIRLSIIKTAHNKIGQIIIGNNFFLPGTCIVSCVKVEIKDNVLVGPGVMIMDCSVHNLEKRGQKGELESLKMAPVIPSQQAATKQ